MNLQKIKPEKLYDKSRYHNNMILLLIVLYVIMIAKCFLWFVHYILIPITNISSNFISNNNF